MAAQEVIQQQQLHHVSGESDEEDFFGFKNPGDISDIDFEGLTSDSDDEESDESDGERLDTSQPWSPFLSNVRVEAYVSPTGPTFQPPEDPSALSLLEKLFGDKIINRIVQETNCYVNQKLTNNVENLAHWTDTTSVEIRAYLGVVIMMAINYLPQVALYWSSDVFLGNEAINTIRR